ncbi:MAG: arginine--tRNA ligase [Candidatus Thermoplasmatota archaeon]
MHDPLLQFVKACEEAVRSALSKIALLVDDLQFSTPPEGMGDLALPCFRLSKRMGRSPAEIAKDLRSALEPSPYFACSVTGPYLNFAFSDTALARALFDSLFALKNRFGSHPPKGTKVIIEHTSANPTDRLHVGRGRNPIIGDTLARLMRAAGYSVETQYYVDDMGRQAALKTLAVRHSKTYQWASAAAGESQTTQDHDPAVKEEMERIIAGAERGEPGVIEEMSEVCAEVMRETIEPTLEKLGAKVDLYVTESRFVMDGSVKRVLDSLRSAALPQENGALYMDMEGEKIFLCRADGTSLYPARDVAYHLWKLAQCDLAVNVLGEDHKLEAKAVETALRLLGSEKAPRVLFYAFVSLPEGKMSTRKGRAVFIDDLLDESVERALKEVDTRRPELSCTKRERIAKAVGHAAVRYNIVRVQAEKPMIFKWEEALNFEGNSAPFIQYAHARACSILAKADAPERPQTLPGMHKSELKLMRTLAHLPSTVSKCALEMTPHPLASYAFALASDFNQFYRDCRVLNAEDELRSFRLALVQGTKWALGSVLDILGIEALEEM